MEIAHLKKKFTIYCQRDFKITSFFFNLRDFCCYVGFLSRILFACSFAICLVFSKIDFRIYRPLYCIVISYFIVLLFLTKIFFIFFGIYFVSLILTSQAGCLLQAHQFQLFNILIYSLKCSVFPFTCKLAASKFNLYYFHQFSVLYIFHCLYFIAELFKNILRFPSI